MREKVHADADSRRRSELGRPFEELPTTHPRLSGSHARALRLARENDVPLTQIVAMSSYNSAAPLGKMGLRAMQERGRMPAGMVADITVFDPLKVTGHATCAKGTLPSAGIPWVVVSGTIVVKDSEALKGVNPGHPIRVEPAKRRFEPLSLGDGAQKFYAAPVDFGGGVPGSQPRAK
jgi:N-acyl-D-aspartate/D-glutamate deacylase